MKAGILNVTGYAGAELARILHKHPGVEITSVTGRSASGKALGEIFPHLFDLGLTISEDLTGSVDLVFSALPHSTSAERLKDLVSEGVMAIDISADFRLKDLNEYEEWYKVKHPCPEYLENAIYGLPELHRSHIASAKLVANPGCFPTAAILALAPALSAGIVEPDVIIDAKTGVSGSGRSLSMSNHFSEVNENVTAYSVEGHRHLPEITQELGAFADMPLRVTFLTHLVPMTRGILASCYAKLKCGVSGSYETTRETVKEIYEAFYDGAPFVRVTNSPPGTKHTLGNNTCVIYPTVDRRTGRLIVISCLDNLVKGAAGQAVQNMNLMLGLDEEEGLSHLALYP